MTDKAVNPFDLIQGGGLWDGKTVTILESKTELDAMTYGDGTPVLRGDEPVINRVWTIKGVAEDEDRERRESYSLGGLHPTADGTGFTKVDGTPGRLHASSGAGKFVEALRQGGYDVTKLLDESNTVHVDRLVGEQFVFTAVPRLDKDGNPKKNKKGYPENDFYPQTYVGRKEGVGAPKGNGVDPELKAFASESVVELLKENGGSLSRADLIKKLSAKLKGDTRSVAVVGLVVKESFYEGSGVKKDGTQIALA